MKWQARRLSQRLLRRPVVLAYHRIAKPSRDPLLLAVSPEHFAQQLDVLSHIATAIGLRELVESRAEPRNVRGGVTITFDDGYLDNLAEARPLLERVGSPATVFVTTGAPGGRFWWDDLERLVLAPTTIPTALQLEVGGVAHEWNLSEEVQDVNGSETWNIRARVDSPRQRLFRELSGLLRPLTPDLRQVAVDAIARWSDAAAPEPLDVRSMTGEEIAELAAGGLIEIGAHTVNHPVLASLPPERQRFEIEESGRFVAAVTGSRPASFAYPFGGMADYNRDTVDIMRASAFGCAVTTIPGTIDAKADRYQLPRFLVRDWDGDEFERRFRRLLYG